MEVTLRNTTKKLCIIGDPVSHSRSPILQNAMLRALGLDYVYLCQRVAKGDAQRWLECAAFCGYAGFNATMPHKQDLVPLMDELDPVAKRCGAVNTVCIKDGKYYGYNTDAGGFLRALEEIQVSPAGKRVLLLGAGGAAKAVTAALVEAGAAVTLANRTAEKARELCRMAPEQVRAVPFDDGTLRAQASESDLLVNCTCLGMAGTAEDFQDLGFLEALPSHAVVCDAIYAPPETSLLRRARELGHRTMNGEGMLLHQAVLALERFVDQPIDRAKAKAAALEAMGTLPA